MRHPGNCLSLGTPYCGEIVSLCQRIPGDEKPFDCMLYMDRRFPGLRILDVLPAVIIHGAAASYADPAGQRCAPAQLTPMQKSRFELFLAGCNLRISTSFAWHWGIRAKRRCLRRS